MSNNDSDLIVNTSSDSNFNLFARLVTMSSIDCNNLESKKKELNLVLKVHTRGAILDDFILNDVVKILRRQ